MRTTCLFALALMMPATLPTTLAARPPAPAAGAGAVRLLATQPLTIRTARGTQRFTVEVARTEAEQARGLMFRRRIAPNGGMIFPMNPPRFASFWMKNTLVPLDLLFIRGDGTIAGIAANATPLSLSPIMSGEPVVAVLELAGGRAAQGRIKTGDRIAWGG